MTKTQTSQIRDYTLRYGFEAACERYGESTVRAAWLPED